MYIVNRKIDRRFNTFEEALECAVKYLLSHHGDDEVEWVLKRTKKGWTVKEKRPFKFNGITYSNVQFIQEF